MTRSYRNNNPGNIIFGPFARKYEGQMEKCENARFAVFPTAAKGVHALVALLSGISYKDLNIKEAIYRYAPASENATESYINFVCTYANLQPDMVIANLDAFQFIELVKAITKREGYSRD